MKSKRLSKAKRLSLDIITTLPQPIIETILCLLPIGEAARTSILSRDWRYKWTTIPKLVFSTPDGYQIMETGKLIRAIHQVMSLRQDPIHELTLSLHGNCFGKTGLPSCEVDQILCHLSKNHPVKKLILDFGASSDDCSYNLPFSVFSLHHLTELYLSWCGLDHQPAFNGFGSLVVLSLDFVWISRKTLLRLLSSCPSLKSFRLIMPKDQVVGHENSTMIELFQCLPLIEHLTIWSETIWWFVPDLVPQELPTSLIHLKYFCLEQMSFHHGYALTFLAVLIKNSPNLEKIELEASRIDAEHYLFNDTDYDSDVYEEYHSDVWLEHLSNVWLEHLIELKIRDFSNLEPELEFVKLILAKSPKLKKVSIKSVVKKDQEPGMLKTLLRTPRVSAVEIDVV
ncbi:putative leucine-rich repeat domain superfamily, F-box-like domain superfamily [Helianthus debilis subsp. tardiflorus]